MAAFFQLLIIAVSLAVDAASAGMAVGIKSPRSAALLAFKLGATFGLFQALMPIAGWLVGELFNNIIRGVDHWVAFILLSLVGVKMIKEALKKSPGEEGKEITNQRILALGLATSIDALAVGFSLQFLNFPILISVGVIGVVTFILTLAGFFLGNKMKVYVDGRLSALGGVALILIGLKILLEHLAIL